MGSNFSFFTAKIMPIPINEFPGVPAMSYVDARQEIRSGDILLCSGNALFSRLIKFATKSIWSHVGFVLRVDTIDRIMVMESVENIGVRTVPLSSYLYNYNGSRKPYNGKILIARHNAFKPEYVHDLSRRAVDLLGYPYDNAEIAKITGRLAWSALGLNTITRELKDNGAYICSEYAYYLFKSVRVNTAHAGKGFVTPGDFAKTPEVNTVCVLS